MIATTIVKSPFLAFAAVSGISSSEETPQAQNIQT